MSKKNLEQSVWNKNVWNKMFGTKCPKKKFLEQNVQKISNNFYLIKCFFVIDISVVDASLDNHQTALCLWTNCLSLICLPDPLPLFTLLCTLCLYVCVLLTDFDELDGVTLDFVVWTTVKVVCWCFYIKKITLRRCSYTKGGFSNQNQESRMARIRLNTRTHTKEKPYLINSYFFSKLVRQKKSIGWVKYVYVCVWDMCWRNFCNCSLVTRKCEK